MAVLCTEKSLSIRLACVDDLVNVVDIYNQAVITKNSTAETTPVDVNDKKAWFNGYINNKQRPMYIVDDESNSMVAWGCFSDLYPKEAYHISAEISIYIHTDYQGQGVGKLFLGWMLQQTVTLNIHNVVAKIFAHNQVSIKLFESFGFSQWGLLPDVCDMQTFIADVVILGKSVKTT